MDGLWRPLLLESITLWIRKELRKKVKKNEEEEEIQKDTLRIKVKCKRGFSTTKYHIFQI